MKKLVVALCLIALPAGAQLPAQPSPTEQALGAKLMQEINAGLTCQAANLTTQADLVKAHARIKELEDKYEPKPTPKPADKPKT